MTASTGVERRPSQDNGESTTTSGARRTQSATVNMAASSRTACQPQFCGGPAREHSNDPSYLTDYYYSLLDDALGRSVDSTKACAFIGHMYTELAKVHAPGPAL